MSTQTLARKLQSIPRPCEICSTLKQFQCSIHRRACQAFEIYVKDGFLVATTNRNNPCFKSSQETFNRIYKGE